MRVKYFCIYLLKYLGYTCFYSTFQKLIVSIYNVVTINPNGISFQLSFS